MQTTPRTLRAYIGNTGENEVPNMPYFQRNTCSFCVPLDFAHATSCNVIQALEKKRFVKFIAQVSLTCVFVWFVMLLINTWLKMAPADSCKQAEVGTLLACVVCRRAFQVFCQSEPVLRNDKSSIKNRGWLPSLEHWISFFRCCSKGCFVNSFPPSCRFRHSFFFHFHQR